MDVEARWSSRLENQDAFQQGYFECRWCGNWHNNTTELDGAETACICGCHMTKDEIAATKADDAWTF